MFVRCLTKVQVYATSTGELTRVLDDAKAPLISLELDLKQPELLIGCTSTGDLLRWNWAAGVLKHSTSLKLCAEGNTTVLTCHLLNLYKGGETACAFVTSRKRSGAAVNYAVVNTSTGETVPVNCGLKLKWVFRLP